MEQSNTNSAGEPLSERRSDSSRWRADAEATNERARRDEQRALAERREQERARAAPAPEVERVPEVEREPDAEPALPQQRAAADGASDPLWQRWWEIQSNFVDDPRSSLAEAHALVSGVVDRAVHQLQEQRSQLEQSWSNGGDISTEDLRRGLQGYREFLGRLLSRKDDTLA